jgi:hypothetical protein
MFKKKNIKLTEKNIKDLLIGTSVEFPNDITFDNPLTIEERVRLGNWYMTFLATEIGQIEAPMTRKELITFLQSLDDIDPEGKMEVVYNDNGTYIEINDVEVNSVDDGEAENVIVIG